MNILVFGAQGSGKSTHAKYIAQKLNIPYVSTGDLFRKLETEATLVGQQIKDRLSKGLMIPNPLTIKLFKSYLASLDLSKGVVLDGYPRNFTQALALPIPIDLIIYISLPEKIAVERLLRRVRSDDTPQSIKMRLDHYKKETAPLLAFFKTKGVKVIEVDNTPPIEVVQRKIDDLLKNQRRNRNNA